MSSTLGNVAASVVRLHKHYGDHKKATTALLKDGGVFGKLSLVEGRCQDVFAEAMTEARVAGTQKIAIERAIKRRPEFALRLCSSFAERLRQSLLHREAATRLATLPLHLGEKFGEEDSAGVLLDVHLTQQDLANMIASTREAVAKVMSELQRDGVIEVRNRRIILLHRELLAGRASGPSGLGYTY
jgi:CRP-like cAMP-binding protein